MQLYNMVAKCLELAAGAEPKLRTRFLGMAISSELDAVRAKSRSLIDASMRLIATDDGIRTALKARDSVLLTRSRACIAQSKQLLARVAIEAPTAAIKPNRVEVRTQPDRNSAMLSVKVFQEKEHFAWMLTAPGNEVLGHGTAETEFKARIAAFDAGMTYIDRLKSRSPPADSSLH